MDPHDLRPTTTSLPDAVSGLAVASVSADGIILRANAAFQALTDQGRSPPADTLQSIIVADNDPLLVQTLLHAVRHGQACTSELLLRGTGDRPFWGDLVVVPQHSHERLIIVRDMTARRAAGEALGEIPSGERLLMERMQAGIVIHRANTEILYANAKATELLGVTPHTVIGAVNSDPRWRFVDEQGELLPIEDYPVGRAVRTREVVRNQLLGFRRDSDRRETWILCNAFPVTAADGTVSEVVVSFTDVTRLKQAEQALQRSEERLRLIVRGSSDAPWDNDFEHGVAYYSPRWYEMLGYAPGELREDSDAWSLLIHPDDRERVLSALGTFMADPSIESYELEFRFLHKSGKPITVLSRAVMLRDQHGRVRRVAGTNSDVTERRALELRLRQSQKMEAIGQLAGGVAHDFNNLLAVIVGTLEMMRSGVDDAAEADELLQHALSAADRGAKLTRRLLAFSRQETLEPIPVCVCDTLHSVASVLRRVISENIAIVVACTEEVPQVLVDATLLENALLNLAINARDAMPHGGTLTLEATAVRLPADAAVQEGGPVSLSGAFVRLTVRDTGVGMADEVLARALEPFYTTKPVGQGTGLGLAMVYGFAQQSGGEMTIASTPGVGTTVTLMLPVAHRGVSTSSERPLVLEPPPRPSREEVILLVEDDAGVRHTCQAVLRRMGFTVVDAEDGPSALRIMCTLPRIDLVLTDVIMPNGLSGPDLVARIRTERPDVAVVYMSGYHDDILSAEAKRSDFHLLDKPFSLQSLTTQIERLLPGRVGAAAVVGR